MPESILEVVRKGCELFLTQFLDPVFCESKCMFF